MTDIPQGSGKTNAEQIARLAQYAAWGGPESIYAWAQDEIKRLTDELEFQTERAAILATGVGMARVYLPYNVKAKAALDEAAAKTHALLLARFPDTVALTETEPDDVRHC